MLQTWVRWFRRRLTQNPSGDHPSEFRFWSDVHCQKKAEPKTAPAASQAGLGSIENYLALCPHICMPLHYQLVLDNFSNFRLYGQHRRGATAEQLAIQHKMSAVEVTERIEAGRLCMEKQVRVEDVHAPCRTVDSIA